MAALGSQVRSQVEVASKSSEMSFDLRPGDAIEFCAGSVAVSSRLWVPKGRKGASMSVTTRFLAPARAVVIHRVSGLSEAFTFDKKPFGRVGKVDFEIQLV